MPDQTTPKWFITFCNGSDRANKYALLQSQEYGDARREAFKRFGTHWAFFYPISDLAEQIDRYGITEWVEEPPLSDTGKGPFYDFLPGGGV